MHNGKVQNRVGYDINQQKDSVRFGFLLDYEGGEGHLP